MKALVVVTCALVTASSPARARPSVPRWLDTVAALLHYELAVVHDVQDTQAPPPRFRELGLAGARLHGFFGGRHVIYHAALELAAGATTRAAGFAYDVALLPVGVGLRFGEDQLVAVAAGVGASGATQQWPAAATFPVEAIAEFQLGSHVRLLARGRAIWTAGAVERAHGARLADELDGIVAVRVGRRFHEYGFASGNGYFVGAAYRELEGSRFIGGVIGYSIDLANTRPLR
jgi:hypothetical protein